MKSYDVKPHLPYPWQQYVLNHLTYINVIVAARQHGKTYLITQLISSEIYTSKRQELEIVMLCDTATRLYKLYKSDFDKAFSANPLYKWKDDKQSTIELLRPDGSVARIFLFGTIMNPFTVKGTHPSLIVMDEAGLNHPRTVTEGCMPATDKSKGRIIVTGTVEDNWYHELWLKAGKKIEQGSDNWFRFMVTFGDTWSKEVHTDHDLKLIQDKYDMDNIQDKMIFEKEYMNNWFASSEGKPYVRHLSKSYQEGRITQVFRNSNFKVSLTWDNGLGTTAIWFFQVIYGVPRFFKYHEWKEESVQKITTDILKSLKQWDTEIDTMIYPHTMGERIQNDPKLSSIGNIFKTNLNFNGKIHYVPKISKIENKEYSVVDLLNVALFDEENCGFGLNCLNRYKRSMTREEKHRYSHAVDSLAEMAMARTAGIIKETNGFYGHTFDMSVRKKNRPINILGPY